MPTPPNSLQMVAIARPHGVVLQLSGSIDEGFDRSRFVDDAGDRNVIIDFSGVKRITSFGVREWMSALDGLRSQYLGYVNVRPAVMAQFNMVAGFGGRGQLLTFYLPYLCPKCGKDCEVLLDVRKDYEKIRHLETPQVLCPECGTTTDFDDDPSFYFSFVAGAPAPAPPADVALLLGEEVHRLRIDKAVEGAITGIWLSGELQRSGSFKRLMEGLEGDVVLILDGIRTTDPEGILQLTKLLSMEGPNIYLARVPLPTLALIATNPVMRARAVLLSVRLELTCVTGHRQELDFDAAYVMGLSEALPPACPLCGNEVSLKPAESLRQLRFEPLPKPIAAFLKSHGQPPERPGSSPGSAPRLTPTGTPTPLEAGSFGRYELIRRLGIGGMAEVYLARQHAMGGFEKQVVLKRILPGLSTDPSFRDMFLQEARLAARISNPNVVQIFDVGHLDGIFYIAMEFVEGSDLSRLLRAAREKKIPFPHKIAARIAADICAGLSAAHTSVGQDGTPLPIIHRDVSPHNVLISKGGHVKLTDFGIAKALDSTSNTPSSSLKGKITYMAPELIQPGPHAFDARSDLFPVGIMLYELLTLEHPFRRATEYSTLVSIVQDEIPDVRKLQPSIPQTLWEITARALERDVDKRYQTARALQQDLEAFMASVAPIPTVEDVAATCLPLMPVANEHPLPPMGSARKTAATERDRPTVRPTPDKKS